MKTRMFRAGRLARHESLRFLSVCCILLFAVLPLLTLAFNITGKDWAFILKDRKFSEASESRAEMKAAEFLDSIARCPDAVRHLLP